MLGDINIDWRLVVYPLIAVSYFQLMRYLDRRYARKKPFTDQEYLVNLARFSECSEFDIFKEAATYWHVHGDRVDADFRHYLMTETLPYYVTDFVRKTAKGLIDKNYWKLY